MIRFRLLEKGLSELFIKINFGQLIVTKSGGPSKMSFAQEIITAIQNAIGRQSAVLHEPSFYGNESKYVQECIDSTFVSSVGKFVDRFEKELADYTGANYAIAVVNGTAALHIALMLAGVETGDDSAVFKINDEQAVVATTDFFMPIVDDPYDFGRISATNALSDIYAIGGQPIMALAIAGFPVNGMSNEDIGLVLAGGAAVCEAAGVPVAGGHTIDAKEPIYGLAVTGIIHPDKIKRNSDGRAGDVLILGKGLGVGRFGIDNGTQLGLAGRENVRVLGALAKINGLMWVCLKVE